MNGGYVHNLENEVMASWRAKSRNALYRNDPEAWVADVLGYRWHEKQREVAQNFVSSIRSATKSANGTGKTRIFGELAPWGICTHEPGELLIIASSPSATQLKDGLFGYVDKNINRARSRGFEVIGYLTDTPTWSFRADNKSKAKTLMRGRTPPRQDIVGTFQGIRAIADNDASTWVLIDEGGAVHDDLYVAAEAVTTGAGNNKIGVIGNPDRIGTYFQKIFEDKKVAQDWATATIAATDLPTFTGEIVYPDDPEMQRQMLTSGMIDPAWVEQKKRSWGEGSARYLSKVLGEFPAGDDYSFFSMVAINRADNTIVIPDGRGARTLGVDFADNPGAGDDSKIYLSVEGDVQPEEGEETLEPVRGCQIRHRDTWQDGGESANRVHMAALETEADTVVMDQLGVGAGPFRQVCNRSDRYYTAMGVKNSWKSPDDSRWANYRAYMYDLFREGMLSGEIDLDFLEEGPNGEEFGAAMREQLLSIRFDFNNKGAIQIEPKKEMKKRGVDSPDDLDAAIMSYRKISQPVIEDPLSGMEKGDVVLEDPWEADILSGVGMPI